MDFLLAFINQWENVKKHECSGQLYSQIAYTIMTKCVCLKSQIFFSQSL